jgi:hypothetical protein
MRDFHSHLIQHRDRAEVGLESSVLFFGLLSPMTALPQVYNVWVLDQVGGLSVVTIGSALFMAVLYTGYGLFHRKRALWMSNGAWITLHSATIGGLLLHR